MSLQVSCQIKAYVKQYPERIDKVIPFDRREPPLCWAARENDSALARFLIEALF